MKRISKRERNRRLLLWEKALRSGEFDQARQRLRRGDAMCCLGVACEVFRRETGNGEWDQNLFVIGNEDGEIDMPRQVATWFGLKSRDPLLSESNTASGFNDTLKYDFVKIADRIRIYLRRVGRKRAA